jgi:hypothetical protein
MTHKQNCLVFLCTCNQNESYGEFHGKEESCDQELGKTSSNRGAPSSQLERLSDGKSIED